MGRSRTAVKTKIEEQANKEAELFMKDVESARKLLVKKGAEDLIPMILISTDEYKSITQLPMPLGAKK